MRNGIDLRLHLGSRVHRLRRQQPDPDDPHARRRPIRGSDRLDAANPYLMLAAHLAAGLDGVARRIDPGDPNLGNLYALDRKSVEVRGLRILPQTLIEALDELERDEVVREALGPISSSFLELKRDEWREYHSQVESWEIDRYLTAI